MEKLGKPVHYPNKKILEVIKSSNIQYKKSDIDFSNTEIQSALDLEYVPVTLGNNRLRTETAAVMTCASFALFETPS